MRKTKSAFWSGIALLSLMVGCGSSGGGGEDDPGGTIVTPCDPKQNICLSEQEVLHCVGSERKRAYCPEGTLCFGGVCGSVVCEPGSIDACLENGKFSGCNPLGTGKGEFDCAAGLTCVDGACVPRVCVAGSGRCLDESAILLCNEAGTAYTVQTPCVSILPKSVCDEGACVSICEKTTKEASYIGCEYWAVDLHNAIDAGVYDAAGQPFAVVLSNAHDVYSASVVIRIKEDGRVRESLSFEIPPKGIRTVYLPDKCYDGGVACPRAYAVNNTSITDVAYYIKSDLPITAAQFNPLNNVGVYSNDASLLFPTTALGKRYMALGRPQHYDQFHAFVTVVATEPGQTAVEFVASCNIRAGVDKTGGVIHAMKRGDKQTFILDQYDVLNLETAKKGDDVTGSLVTSDKLVAVFAGVEATSIPETDPVTCCADHIEHQQYPLSAWGRRYNAVKLKPRGKERDVWRILARTDATRVTTRPQVTSSPEVILGAGEWIDILTTESFTIEATAPVLVGQFMASQNDPLDPDTLAPNHNSANIGDPSYIIGVPVEQYRREYVFLVPAFFRENFITVIAPVGARVWLDGEEIAEDAFTLFGTGTFRYAYHPVNAGRHDLVSDMPVGLFTYGFDDYVSYGYPAGLDLRDLFE
ncbi:MAG: IgGFc-binding protein [Proteobacteria bacterium]|nr:IgGFc-binding protein [Pseudomonadota bacterium]